MKAGSSRRRSSRSDSAANADPGRHHVCGEAGVAGARSTPGRATTTQSRPERPAEARLDLAELDPVAVDLHLVIAATAVLDDAVGPVERDVARVVEGRARVLGRSPLTNRSAVRSGRLR